MPKQAGGSRKQEYREHRLTKPYNEHLRERMRDPTVAIGYLTETFKSHPLTFEQAVKYPRPSYTIWQRRGSTRHRSRRIMRRTIACLVRNGWIEKRESDNTYQLTDEALAVVEG